MSYYLSFEHHEDNQGGYELLNTYTLSPNRSNRSSSSPITPRLAPAEPESVLTELAFSHSLAMGGPVGTPSFRKYSLFNLESEDDICDWNLVIDRPHDTKDLRWADSLKLFAEEFTVTPTCWPPASTHLSDNIVGQLIHMSKAGHIELNVLGQRWPSTFNKAGQLLKTRRPLGEACLIQGKIAVANDGSQLLCGAGFKKLPKVGSTPKSWFWLLEGSATKGRLRASEVELPENTTSVPQTFHYKALTEKQRVQNAQPNGYIFKDDTGDTSDQVHYPDETELPAIIKPTKAKFVSRKPDPGERKQDLAGFWTDREGGDSVQDKVGLMAFALGTPDVLKFSKLERMQTEDMTKYKIMVDKDVKIKKEDASKPEPDKEKSKSAKPESGKEKPPSSKRPSTKPTNQPTRGLRSIALSSDDTSSAFSTTSEPERGSSHADTAALLQHIQAYEDHLARLIALSTAFVNGNRDILFEALEIIENQVKEITGNSSKDKVRKSDLHDFMKMVKKRTNSYSGEIMAAINPLADVLIGSAYDVDRTFERNSSQSSDKIFKSGTTRDSLPEQMETLKNAAPVWSKTVADYPVSLTYKQTVEYRRLAKGHLRKFKGESFYRRRKANNVNRYDTDIASSDSGGNDADDEDDEDDEDLFKPLRSGKGNKKRQGSRLDKKKDNSAGESTEEELLFDTGKLARWSSDEREDETVKPKTSGKQVSARSSKRKQTEESEEESLGRGQRKKVASAKAKEVATARTGAQVKSVKRGFRRPRDYKTKL